MLTPRIKFVNFQIVKNKKIKISHNFFKIKNLISKYKFLISLTSFYKYGYSKKLVKNLKKNSVFKIIGMGGSTLGAETIYQFLRNYTNKEFIFINNLKTNLTKYEKNTKAINLIISKSGNTLETISNSNLLLKKYKNIFITEKKIVIYLSLQIILSQKL